MKWPAEIVDQFVDSLGMTTKGETPEAVVECMLDVAAKCAAWRVEEKNCNYYAAFISPYTPLGHASVTVLTDKADKFVFNQKWSAAVDRFYDWVKKNEELLTKVFNGQGIPFDDE